MKDLTGGDSGSRLIEGPAGPMEILFDVPQQLITGLAVVAHPQPLLGGNAKHKIPQLLAKALCEAGWLVLRPNFRGVGRSAGVHDSGIGETNDLLGLCGAARASRPGLKLALIGFSFGAFVQARVAHALQERGDPAWRVCLLGMPYGEVEGGRRYDTPQDIQNASVVHGEADERVPLKAVLDWARPSSQPVVVVPGADHFFTGRLQLLRSLVLAQLGN